MTVINNILHYYRDYGIFRLLSVISVKILRRDIITPLIFPVWYFMKRFDQGWIKYQGVKIDLSDKILSKRMKYEFMLGYEIDEMRLLNSHLKESDHLIELGAGLGFVSCFANMNVDIEEDHIVVEANPELIPIIRKHETKNKCSYEIIQKAYSANSGAVEFNVHSNFFSSGIEQRKQKYDKHLTVESISINEICENNNIDTFDLVLDIEGQEHFLFKDELDILKTKCKTIIVEFHDIDCQPTEDTIKLINKNGFDIIESKNDVVVFTNQLFT